MSKLSACAVIVAATGVFVSMGVTSASAQFGGQPKVTICHKFGTPAEQTLEVAYPGAIGHVKSHGDFLGACPEFDSYIDVDGQATTGRGIPEGINVQVGDPLTSWPTGFALAGLDWFDNDGNCVWTLGDDLHEEDPAVCPTALRDGLYTSNANNQDCVVLDLDASLTDGQQVDVDLESGTSFTGCPGPDPELKFHDRDSDGFYDDGEDIVLDVNGNGIFD